MSAFLTAAADNPEPMVVWEYVDVVRGLPPVTYINTSSPVTKVPVILTMSTCCCGTAVGSVIPFGNFRTEAGVISVLVTVPAVVFNSKL